MSDAAAALRALRDAGALDALDVRFATTVAAIAGERRPSVVVAAALACRASSRGDVCLDVVALAARGAVILDDGGRAPLPFDAATLKALKKDLVASSLVGDGGDGAHPLVLDAAGRLYLARAFLHERRLARALLSRASAAEDAVDEAALARALDALFPAADAGPDLQRAAAALAARRRVVVVSGGPGTGKTWTVVRVVALLAELARARGAPAPRVALVAPTGKAAARLVESVRAAKADLAVDDVVKEAVPEQASTIHRALGARRDGTFRRSAHEPLLADVVVVDEASMVHSSLMDRLVDALPPTARLVLLGDKDQLASVEAGAVLADVCAGDAGPLAPCLIHLTRARRYAEGSGIGRLAAAVQRGDVAAVEAVLDAGLDDVVLRPPVAHELPDALAAQLAAQARALTAPGDDAAALAALATFRVLCAHRRGQGSVEVVNRLAAAGAATRAGAPWEGRPILVLQNAPHRGLMNGDVGVLRRGADGALRAAFDDGGTVRTVPLSWLPPHETVFATTIHKSQGSEFDEVAVLLPEDPSPVVVRELLYTAATRAKRRVVLYATRAAVLRAVQRPTERATGLRDLLWGAPLATPAQRVRIRQGELFS